MSNIQTKEFRINLMNKVSTTICEKYMIDSNHTNLDVVLSLYLEFQELEAQIPKCIDDVIKNSIKEGNVVETLKVKRGRGMDLDQQFNVLMCLLIIQTLEGKSKLNKYNKNGLSVEACVKKTASDCNTSISNVNKCIKKYGSAFKYYITTSTPEISFIFNRNTVEESSVTLKDEDQPITDMLTEALDILFE